MKLGSHANMVCILKQLESPKAEDFSGALRCISLFFVSDDDSITQKAIFEGFFPRVLELINVGTSVDKKNALFGLSNITGGVNKDHVRLFMEEE